eukprot:8133840-Alexandrium_andersonii.AAC.1
MEIPRCSSLPRLIVRTSVVHAQTLVRFKHLVDRDIASENNGGQTHRRGSMQVGVRPISNAEA